MLLVQKTKEVFATACYKLIKKNINIVLKMSVVRKEKRCKQKFLSDLGKSG